MKIMLSSGSWIQITGVKLYPETQVSQIQTMRMQARNALGPGLALGVIGAPGLTLAAEAVALSLVSGFLANAAAKRAAEELKKAQALHERMIANDGVFVDVDRIGKIELPLPHLWRAKRDDGDVYLHSGDDFVAIASPQGQFLINWRDVSAIQFSSGAETAHAGASAITP